MSFYLCNARSIKNKLTQFQSFVYSRSNSCFCVCETRLNDYIKDSEILPLDYQIFHSDRLTTGGGVLVAVHSCIPARQLYTRSSESAIVELDITPKTVICCFYIPPYCFDEFFSVAIDTLNSIQIGHDVILTGDFNVPDIDWLTITAPTNHLSSLCDIFFSKNLVNLVTQPTHQLGNILDLVLSNSPDKISNLAIDIPDTTLSSDHSVIAFDVNSANPVRQMASKSIFCYSKADLVVLDCYLLDVDYNPIYTCLDVNMSNQFLKSVFHLTLHQNGLMLRSGTISKQFTL